MVPVCTVIRLYLIAKKLMGLTHLTANTASYWLSRLILAFKMTFSFFFMCFYTVWQSIASKVKLLSNREIHN